jgi:L-ribulokinase
MKYSLGIDFGTESGRVLLVEVETGREVATSVHQYKDGVIDEVLPDGVTKLGPDWALQNPADYIETLKATIPAVIKDGGVDPKDVVGIGIDFTACTVVPTDRDGTPLCFIDRYKKNPHAWVKLWKHHASQPDADRINELAKKRGEKFLARYGGKTSSEWLFAKILQTLDEAPEIYQAAGRFIEGGDWVVLQMTGNERRNACAAGYKGLWEKGAGYPSREFFKALDRRMENVVQEKLSADIYPPGVRAGGLTPQMAKLTGLREGTAVATAIIDAHAAVPGASVVEPGKMVIVMGTSFCHMIVDREKKIIEGISGVVEDGIIPDYFGYEAGQAAGGDTLAWFVENFAPAKGKPDPYAYLEQEASKIPPGRSGLLALDWWNGNRSILVDADLTGLIVGLTLGTKPEEIFRAIIEATAFGTYKIAQAFEEGGVKIKEIYACGGLPEKNRLLMQIFADATGREIKVARSSQASALGAAMLGAVAAGRAGGGYDNIAQAAARMAGVKDVKYTPNPQAHQLYNRLFAHYERLHDYFGRGGNDVMKALKRIKEEIRS